MGGEGEIIHEIPDDPDPDALARRGGFFQGLTRLVSRVFSSRRAIEEWEAEHGSLDVPTYERKGIKIKSPEDV